MRRRLLICKTSLISDQSVISVVPILQSFVMISHKEQQTGVVLQGIDPQLATLKKLADNMLSRPCWAVAEGEFGVILGSQLARKLDVFVGDRLQLTLPKVSVRPPVSFPASSG